MNNARIGDNNEASDAALLGPGNVVVDKSPSQGTTIGNPVMSPELNQKIMVPLVGDKVVCPVCER